MTLYTFGIFIYMSYVLVGQQAKINDLENENANTTRKIQEIKYEIEILEAKASSMSEDSYIEEVARSLGYVKADEMIIEIVN